MPRFARLFALACLSLLVAAPGGPPPAADEPAADEPAAPALAPPSRAATDEYGFRFVRIRFESNRRSRWGTPAWRYDWPTAEAIARTTSLRLAGEPIVLDLTDDRIFEHPILYLCEPGYWKTNDEEVANLQEYFARGGFMIIDDFHDYGDGRVGPQWINFYNNLKQIFPDREPVELGPEHPIWSVYYDVDPVAAWSTKYESGEVWYLDQDDDTYYGIFDDDGRLMMVICYNQDIGDGWEWPERNLHEASTVSFQMAINFILYALTH